jgi:hypothetical protein
MEPFESSALLFAITEKILASIRPVSLFVSPTNNVI